MELGQFSGNLFLMIIILEHKTYNRNNLSLTFPPAVNSQKIIVFMSKNKSRLIIANRTGKRKNNIKENHVWFHYINRLIYLILYKDHLFCMKSGYSNATVSTDVIMKIDSISLTPSKILLQSFFKL